MFFYLPHAPESYRGAFPSGAGQKREVASHTIVEAGDTIMMTPESFSMDVLHPQKFINLKEAYTIEKFWLIDYTKEAKTLIQIIDHRNYTGLNPLRGRTPIGDRPRFPDVSNIYEKKEIGLPQRAVNSVGPHRFKASRVPDVSEVVAIVGLCAAYAGIHIIAIGWNREIDGNGNALTLFIKGVLYAQE